MLFSYIVFVYFQIWAVRLNFSFLRVARILKFLSFKHFSEERKCVLRINIRSVVDKAVVFVLSASFSRPYVVPRGQLPILRKAPGILCIKFTRPYFPPTMAAHVRRKLLRNCQCSQFLFTVAYLEGRKKDVFPDYSKNLAFSSAFVPPVRNIDCL